MSKIKVTRAIISVFDKTGIVEFAKELSGKYGYEVVSTGGTYKLLEENGVEATEVSEVTGFPELLGGRVKSLHPKIHAGILARHYEKSDMDELSKNDIKSFDIVETRDNRFDAVKNTIPFLKWLLRIE